MRLASFLGGNHRYAVERRHRISFRPEADHSGLAERVVVEFDQLFVVQIARDVAADVDDADRVPLAGRLRHLHGLAKDHPFALHDVEEAKITFERVESSDVVVVLVLTAPNGSTPLIELSGDWLQR